MPLNHPIPVYLLTCDLRPSTIRGVSKFVGIDGKWHPSSNSSLVLTISHWALLIDEMVYEITSTDYYGNTTGDAPRLYRGPIPFDRWLQVKERDEVKYDSCIIGATRCNRDEVAQQANHIWCKRFKGIEYDLKHSNCQDFVLLLRHAIKLNKQDLVIWNSLLPSFHIQPVPTPLSLWWTRTKFSGGLVALSAAGIGLKALVIGAVINPHVAVVLVGGGLLVMPLLLLGKNNTYNIKNYASQLLHKFRTGGSFLNPHLREPLRASIQEYSGYDIDFVNSLTPTGFYIWETVAALQQLGVSCNNGHAFKLDKSTSEAVMRCLLHLQEFE